jgi:hypothetical protein
MKRFLIILLFAGILSLLSAESYAADVGAKAQCEYCVVHPPDVSISPMVTIDLAAHYVFNLLPMSILPETKFSFAISPTFCILNINNLGSKSKSKGYSGILFYNYRKYGSSYN